MIVGITGKKSSGKDTVAEYLCEQYGFQKLSFAALLKISAAALFDIDPRAWESWKNDPSVRVRLVDESERDLVLVDLSVRELLQRYGTEAHRNIFGDHFWVEQMWAQVLDYGAEEAIMVDGVKVGGDFVISDCRFANEAHSIVAHGGVIWRVVRPGQDEADTHASEDLTQTDPFVSLEVKNDGGFEKLYYAVDELVENGYCRP